MKAYIKLVIFFSIVSIFSSCHFFLKIVSGVDTSPNLKSKKDIESYATRKKLGISSQYSFSYSYYSQTIAGGSSLPRLDIYNSKGHLLKYTNNNDCTADARGLLEKISNLYFLKHHAIDSLSINPILKNLYTLDGDKTNLTLEDKGFTAVVFK